MGRHIAMVAMRSRAVVRMALAMVAAVLGLAPTSCIDPGTPVPDVDGVILAFEVEGQLSSTVNPATRTVDIELVEAADIRSVKITRLSVCESGRCDLAEGDVVDLSRPRKLIVRTVAGYEWTIRAVQNIEYRFEVEGQVGEARFEMHSGSVFAYVSRGTDMTRIKIVDVKFAPEGVAATLTPALAPGDVVSFRSTDSDRQYVRDVGVTCRGEIRMWHLYVAEVGVQMSAPDPFARRVYLSAYGEEDGDNRFEYAPGRSGEDGSDDGTVWTTVPASMMTGGNKGVFTATLTGLTPNTDYMVRAVSGGVASEAETFTTGGERELPGGGFDEWHQGPDPRRTGTIANVRAWNPWREGAQWEVDRWWDSGNRGVAIVDQSSGGNSLRTEQGEGSPADPAGRAARLETRWAMVKAAGGNIYFGEFGEMDGLDATCHIGHGWQTKPTGLKGWYKYFPQPIDEVSEKHRVLHPYGLTTEQWMGSSDSLHVCVALWADPRGRNIPFTVNSKTDAFVDFSRDAEGMIAYGAFVSAREQAEWGEFTIDMEYLKPGPLPPNTQLYVLVTASKNCNYFIAGTGRGTGGGGSLMYVDELELVYD